MRNFTSRRFLYPAAISFALCSFLYVTPASAQKKSPQAPAPARTADFITRPEGDGIRFQAVLPALSQVAGAPEAFWSTYWEFGDGSFAFGANPEHTYAGNGDYEVYLAATNNYDDGKPPAARKKKIKPKQSYADAGKSLPDVFDPKQRQGIALRVNRDPVALEELSGIISYRNNSKFTTDGALYLFFNEKAFKSEHFTFQEARTHFGERTDLPATGLLTPTLPEWLPSPALSGVGESWEGPSAPENHADALLAQASRIYRSSQVWHFSELKPGEKRNLFVTLLGAASMLSDTNAFIHLQVVYAPNNPSVEAEAYTLEMEIVNSHDPNRLSVSDRRANFRGFKRKALGYKLQFQNNGEGPARTVELSVTVPGGFKQQSLKLDSWYPKCPICPEKATQKSCLDTTFTEQGLTFTFRNIYLPGSRQQGVADYDSTKGYVKYQLAAGKRVSKRPLSSQASIVFDQNPPIRTNRPHTRFKTGLSPGIKGGYQWSPDTAQSGLYFVGLTLSPYKSYKIFPQIELMAGLPGGARSSITTTSDTTGIDIPAAGTVNELDTFFVKQRRNEISTRTQRYELALLLRKNLNGFFGIGAGLSAQHLRNEATTQYTERVVQYIARQKQIFKKEVLPQFDKSGTDKLPTSETRLALIGELRFGWVRAGLQIGIRGAYGLQKDRPSYVQLSAEYKF